MSFVSVDWRDQGSGKHLPLSALVCRVSRPVHFRLNGPRACHARRVIEYTEKRTRFLNSIRNQRSTLLSKKILLRERSFFFKNSIRNQRGTLKENPFAIKNSFSKFDMKITGYIRRTFFCNTNHLVYRLLQTG